MAAKKITNVDMKEIEKSKEFKKYQTTLNKFNDRAMKAIADSTDEKHALKKISSFTEKLESVIKEPQKMELAPSGDLPGRAKCPPGTTFDPNTGTCV